MTGRAARAFALTALFAAAALPVAAQEFGKNQVEYHRFEWQVIETEHFTIHYYPQEATAAMDVARMAERAYNRLSRVFQWEFREKKPIMLFASRADFGENLVTGDLGEGTGGVTELARHRMLFFFTGNYRTTEHVLTHEMVHEFQYDIFAKGKAGGGYREMAAVNPPLWFMEGMAEYLSKGPDDPHTNVIIRDAALNNNIPSMTQMTNEPDRYFPYRYGESFFAYVGRHWGDDAVGSIMIETPTLGIERAFERNTGKNLNEIAVEWKTAMQEQFLPLAATLGRAGSIAQPLLTKHRSGGDVFVDPVLSPDGNYVVFLSNGDFNKGQVFIDLWLADAHTGKRIKRLVKSTLDPNYQEIGLLYSQAAFSPDGKKLAFSALAGAAEVLYVLDVKSLKRIATIKPPLDGLTSPSWSPDGTKIVFSGAHGGLTDLYIVDADGKNLTPLMHDKNGDTQPQWSPDGQTIAFATERGPGTDLGDLVFPRLHIALYHLATRQIELLPNQAGQNINPNWSPDGKTLAYISNRSGIPNVYLYDLASREQFQITNLVGGVTAITDVSPALSWAHAADRLAFTYYEADNYTIWIVDDPRHLERQPVPEVVAAAPKPDTTAMGETGDAAVTYYNAPGGFRRADAFPGGAEPGAPAPISVAAILDTGAVKLPDTTRFLKYPYKTTLSPEYVASPTIGYSHDNFGSGFYGGVGITMADLVGQTRVTTAFAINGRLEDFQLYLAYAYLAGRMQWQVGVQNVPFYYARGTACYAADPTSCYTGIGIDSLQQATTRYLQRTVFANAFYPLNRFDRFEFGANFTDLNRSTIVYTYLPDGTVNRNTYNPSAKNWVSPYLAYVSDNTLFGYFAPISGRRYRLQVQPAIGNFMWTAYQADYRRYDPIVFNKLIVALHLQGYYVRGRDSDSLRQYIGYSDVVRGYDGSSAVVSSNPACQSQQTVATDYCNPMIGSSAVWGTLELRAPFYRGGGGVVPVPPVELFIFADAGSAWFQGQSLVWGSQTNFDPYTTRSFISSHGFGARVNLFGAAILSWAYVFPHDLYGHPYWQFSFYPPF